jgi:multiple sugar transport system permease protein
MAIAQERPPVKTGSEPVLVDTEEMKRRRFQKKLRTSLKAYLFIAPAVIILFLFHFAPIFYAFFLSLYERISVVRGLIPPAENFTGFGNYITLFQDEEAWGAFFNTFGYAVGVVFFGLLASLGVSLLLDKVRTGRNFYRTAFFLPYVTSLVAVGAVWNLIFSPYASNALVRPNPERPGGLINWVFSVFGIPMQRWLLDDRGIFKVLFFNGQKFDLVAFIIRVGLVVALIAGAMFVSRTLKGSLGAWVTGFIVAVTTFVGWSAVVELAHLGLWDGMWGGPSLAMICMIIISIWHGLGFQIVLILAGLTSVSRELYEAARLDGAKGWSMFTKMTVPLLSPTLFFLLIVGTINAFQSFTLFFTIYGNRATGSTSVLATFYYDAAFGRGSGQITAGFGYASAIVLSMLVLIMSISFFQQAVLSKRVNYD